MKRLLCTAALLGLSASSALSATTVVNPWTGFYNITTPYNGTLYGPTPAPTTPNWDVAQWNAYGGYLDNWSLGIFGYHSENADNTIQDSWNTASPQYVNLVDSGWVSSAVHLPCQSNNQPWEMDNFLQPIDSSYPSYPSSVVNKPVVGAINHLYHYLTYRVEIANAHDQNCTISGWATQAFAQSSFILHNTVNGATLFFQIDLYDFQFTDSRYLWWAVGGSNTWGVTIPVTSIAGFGSTFPNTLNHDYTISTLDILPNIKDQIYYGSIHYGLDGNDADWEVTSAYVGNAIWGHTNFGASYINWGLSYD